MKKIKLLDVPAGKLNGQPWPKVGSVVEVDDTFGSFLLKQGIGEAVTDDEKPPAKKAPARKK